MKAYKKLYYRLGGSGSSTSRHLVLILVYYSEIVTLTQLLNSGLFSDRRYIYRLLRGLIVDGYLTEENISSLRYYHLTKKGKQYVAGIREHHVNIKLKKYDQISPIQLSHTLGIVSALYDVIPYFCEDDCFIAEKKIANATFRPDFYFKMTSLISGECFGEEDTGKQRRAVLEQKAASYADYLAFQVKHGGNPAAYSLIFHLKEDNYSHRVSILEDILFSKLSKFWLKGFSTLLFPNTQMNLKKLKPIYNTSFHISGTMTPSDIVLHNGTVVKMRHVYERVCYEEIEHDIGGRYRAEYLLKHGAAEPLTLVVRCQGERRLEWLSKEPGYQIRLIVIQE